MSTATENRQPASLSPLRRLVVRHPVASFLLMLYAIAWGVFLPVVLQARGLLTLPIDLTEGFAFDAVTSLASILGVALPAFLVTAATGGKAGVRELLRRCLRWRVGIVWYLAAILGLLAVMVLVGSVLSDPAPLEVLTERWSLIFTLFLPEVLFPFVYIQFFEEPAGQASCSTPSRSGAGPWWRASLWLPPSSCNTCPSCSWTRASGWPP